MSRSVVNRLADQRVTNVVYLSILGLALVSVLYLAKSNSSWALANCPNIVVDFTRLNKSKQSLPVIPEAKCYLDLVSEQRSADRFVEALRQKPIAFAIEELQQQQQQPLNITLILDVQSPADLETLSSIVAEGVLAKLDHLLILWATNFKDELKLHRANAGKIVRLLRIVDDLKDDLRVTNKDIST